MKPVLSLSKEAQSKGCPACPEPSRRATDAVLLGEIFHSNGDVTHGFCLWGSGKSHPYLDEMLIFR